MKPGGTLPRGPQPWDCGHLSFGVDANSAHHVVRRRSHLHWSLGDVDVRQLHELMVHARELLLDHLRGVGDLSLDPRNVEEHAAVGAAAALADLSDDAASNMISREQLRRSAGRLVTLSI